jgi:hypothetical protein
MGLILYSMARGGTRILSVGGKTKKKTFGACKKLNFEGLSHKKHII